MAVSTLSQHSVQRTCILIVSTKQFCWSCCSTRPHYSAPLLFLSTRLQLGFPSTCPVYNPNQHAITETHLFICWGYSDYWDPFIYLLRLFRLLRPIYLSAEVIPITETHLFICWGYSDYWDPFIYLLKLFRLLRPIYLSAEVIPITETHLFICWGYSDYWDPFIYLLMLFRLLRPIYLSADVIPITETHLFICWCYSDYWDPFIYLLMLFRLLRPIYLSADVIPITETHLYSRPAVPSNNDVPSCSRKYSPICSHTSWRTGQLIVCYVCAATRRCWGRYAWHIHLLPKDTLLLRRILDHRHAQLPRISPIIYKFVVIAWTMDFCYFIYPWFNYENFLNCSKIRWLSITIGFTIPEIRRNQLKLCNSVVYRYEIPYKFSYIIGKYISSKE